jgi:ribose transport system substrate-binding protein
MFENRSSVLRLLAALAALIAVGLVVTACGSSSSSSSSEGSAPETETESEGESSGGETGDIGTLDVGKLNFEMSKYCGTKPTKVGLIDGYGSITWRVQVRALNEKVAKECPNVTEVKYYSAEGDPEKFNSTLSSWPAQGVNVILANPDFGQASVPAFRAAQQAGATVVTSTNLPGTATIPTDVTAAYLQNNENGAKEFVEFLDKATKGTAKVVEIGGAAGTTIDAQIVEGMEKAIEETGADVEMIESEPVASNWEPGKTQQVTASLLSKYPDLNGIVMTYIATVPSVIRAFEAAGKPLPTIAGESSSMEVVCEVAKWKKSDPGFNLFSIDATGNQPPLALARGMAAYQGIEAPELGTADELTYSNYSKYIDTLAGEVPECVTSIPPGADLSMAQTQQEVEKLSQ